MGLGFFVCVSFWALIGPIEVFFLVAYYICVFNYSFLSLMLEEPKFF